MADQLTLVRGAHEAQVVDPVAGGGPGVVADQRADHVLRQCSRPAPGRDDVPRTVHAQVVVQGQPAGEPDQDVLSARDYLPDRVAREIPRRQFRHAQIERGHNPSREGVAQPLCGQPDGVAFRHGFRRVAAGRVASAGSRRPQAPRPAATRRPACRQPVRRKACPVHRPGPRAPARRRPVAASPGRR
jgi:hypothetical protein